MSEIDIKLDEVRGEMKKLMKELRTYGKVNGIQKFLSLDRDTEAVAEITIKPSVVSKDIRSDIKRLTGYKKVKTVKVRISHVEQCVNICVKLELTNPKIPILDEEKTYDVDNTTILESCSTEEGNSQGYSKYYVMHPIDRKYTAVIKKLRQLHAYFYKVLMIKLLKLKDLSEEHQEYVSSLA